MSPGLGARRSLSAALVAVLVAGLLAGVLADPRPAAADDRLERVRSERQALEGEIAEATARLDELTARIHEAEETRAQLTSEVARLQAEAAEARAALRTRAARRYREQSGKELTLVLAASGPGEAIDRARLLDGLGRRERERIERAAAARTALHQRRAELEALSEQLERDKAELAAARERLQVAFRTARQREQELASRRARQRRVARARQEGVYACPIGQPRHFRDTWGAPRSGGRRHRGVDMFAPMGTDIYAITHGVITRRSSSRLGGIGLYLQGDDGNRYYYAHLQRIAPGYRAGRRVEAGELIGFNGDTGNARGTPHLHLEVHPGGGSAVNPYPFAAAACR